MQSVTVSGPAGGAVIDAEGDPGVAVEGGSSGEAVTAAEAGCT
jgi:hypothetical protein